eukprot:2433748-Prymnesium_polylepis.3
MPNAGGPHARAEGMARASSRHFPLPPRVEPRVARLPAEVASRLPEGRQVARLPGCQLLPAVASKSGQPRCSRTGNAGCQQ